ncbi:MAG: metallophosphoesterase family protein [Acidobacteria bacterium]|nr:metallophosphoesterase family protein [Acidobacteriota bacterium]
MRFLILSDIHANVDAFDAVLAAAPRHTWDRALVLGDLVGYGAEPNAVIERVLALEPLAVIRGNHDKAACGLGDASDFNHVARLAAVWTADALTPENRMYLERLPAGPRSIDDGVEICHGAPFDEDYYVFDLGDASRALDTASRPVCLFGHTHLPVVYRRDAGGDAGLVPNVDTDGVQLPLTADARYMINPGSVGQPRDGDPRAAFAIYDGDLRVITLRRVEYPVRAAQKRIFDAGLPPNLAHRLAVGR